MSEVNRVGRGRHFLMLDVCPADDIYESIGFSRPVYPLLHLIENMLAECGYRVMTSAFVELLSLDLDLAAALQRQAFCRAPEGGTSCR